MYTQHTKTHKQEQTHTPITILIHKKTIVNIHMQQHIMILQGIRHGHTQDSIVKHNVHGIRNATAKHGDTSNMDRHTMRPNCITILMAHMIIFIITAITFKKGITLNTIPITEVIVRSIIDNISKIKRMMLNIDPKTNVKIYNGRGQHI